MPWPPTGAYDPVIDIGTMLAGPDAPVGAVTSESPFPELNLDPDSGMIFFGDTAEVDPQFSALPAPNEPRLTPVPVDKKRQMVVDWAISRTKMGIWYKWGGVTDSGYDCSGLVMKAFAQAGIKMPRISYAQAAKGKRVRIGDLQPGDLVAWDHGTLGGRPDHIAIYIGNGEIAEAAHTGTQLRVRKLNKNEGAWGVKLSY